LQRKTSTSKNVRTRGNAYFINNKVLKNTLHDADEGVLREFDDVLNNARDVASVELQRNVYSHYNEFVNIAKEISKLEGDMTVLRSLLNDMRLVNVAMQNVEAVTPRQTMEEEVTQEMQGLQLSQSMQSLNDNVQGLDKVLHANDERVLIHSGGTLLELSSTTLKARLPISFLLYNDTLVVAQRRRNLLGSSKLVLDKCWDLAEITVIDIKDTEALVNGFKIVQHPETYYYKAASAEEKMTWIQNIKRAADEFILSRRSALGKSSSPTPASPMKRADLPPMNTAEATWIEELEDELDVWSATREFEEAVTAISKARLRFAAHSLTQSQRQAQIQVENRATRLSTIISQDLADPLLNKTQVVVNIRWLTRLGFSVQGKTIFLASRTSLTRHRIRSLPFSGSVHSYISSLAAIVFTLIKNTCEWYTAGFEGEKGSASGLLKWVKGEVEFFAGIFRRIVFEAGEGFDVIAECLETTIEESRVVCTLFWWTNVL
jgi:hypothetical protein